MVATEIAFMTLDQLLFGIARLCVSLAGQDNGTASLSMQYLGVYWNTVRSHWD